MLNIRTMSESLSGGWGQQALALLNAGVLVLNEQRVHWVNPYLLSALGLELEDVHSDLLVTAKLTKRLLETDKVFQLELDNASQERWFKREHIKTPDYDVYFFHDCSEWVVIGNECRRLRDEVNELSLKDATTGAINYDVWMRFLDGHISRSRRYNNPLSLLRIRYFYHEDIDMQSFERSIQHIAFFLKDTLRWADQIGMLDKRTFLISLPETNYSSAIKLMKKFNGEQHLALFAKGDGRPLSFSIGLAAWAKGDTAAKMLQNAQQDVDLVGFL